jgi:hypothetical protein
MSDLELIVILAVLAALLFGDMWLYGKLDYNYRIKFSWRMLPFAAYIIWLMQWMEKP